MQKMKENFASVKDLNYLCTHEQRFIYEKRARQFLKFPINTCKY